MYVCVYIYIYIYVCMYVYIYIHIYIHIKEKAEAQLAEARKKEETSLHNFDMLKQSLTDEIEFATKDMEKAKTELSASSEKKATAELLLLLTTMT